MSEATLVTPPGEPARGLPGFWNRYGAIILLAWTVVQGSALYFFDHRYATKDELDTRTRANTTLIYERTRQSNEQIAAVKSDVTQIKTLLDAQGKQQERDAAEIKGQLRDIEIFLRTPRGR